MSITDDFDEDLDGEDDTDPSDNAVIRDLRKQAKEGRKAAKEREELRKENEALKAERLLRQAKLDGLSERQQRAVLREVEGAPSIEQLREIAADLGFIEPDRADQQSAEAQAAMAAAAAGGNAGQHATKGELTAFEFAKWDMAKRVDFMERQPEKFAALERGETVRLA